MKNNIIILLVIIIVFVFINNKEEFKVPHMGNYNRRRNYIFNSPRIHKGPYIHHKPYYHHKPHHYVNPYRKHNTFSGSGVNRRYSDWAGYNSRWFYPDFLYLPYVSNYILGVGNINDNSYVQFLDEYNNVIITSYPKSVVYPSKFLAVPRIIKIINNDNNIKINLRDDKNNIIRTITSTQEIEPKELSKVAFITVDY
jgi:hypothetical protein